MKHRLETCHSSQCCYPRSGGEGPSRSKPPALTEEQIVEAALQVIRDEGLEALSMRRLSRQLKRSAMAAYWYVG